MSTPSGSWIPPFLSRFPDLAPPLQPSSSTSDQDKNARDRRRKQQQRDPNAPAPNSIWTSRGRKQASIFAVGLVSVVWVGSLTRRSMTRRRAVASASAVLDTTAATTGNTIGQGAQAVQSVVRQQEQAVAGAAAHATPTIATQPVRAKTGSIMADTLQAYRNAAAQQTSPGTSIGKVAEVLPTTAATAATTATTAAAAEAAAAAQRAAADLGANAPLLAVEAFILATANVLAWGLMLVGGALWYNDVSSMADLRRVVRGGLLGDDALEQSDEQAEQELEEMLAGLLKRGEERRQRQSDSGSR